MTLESTRIRLQDLLVSAEPWDGGEAIEVDCYDYVGFAAGQPVVRASGALGKGAHRVRAGDVLLSVGTRGPRRAWLVDDARGRPQIATSDWQVLRSRTVDTAYLRHLLVSDDFRQCLESVPRRSRARSKSSTALPDIEWVVPALDRQRQLGQVLDHVDALRTKRAHVLRGAGEIVQSLFGDLFGTQPEVAHGVVPLRDLLIEAPTRGVDAELRSRVGFPILRPVDVREGRLSFADVRYVSHSDAALARTALRDGDVLLACDPARGDTRCALARPGLAVWFMHARLWRLRVDAKRLLPEYLHAWLLTSGGRQRVLDTWVANRRAGVDVRLGSIEVPLPDIAHQRTFADAVGAVDRLQGRLNASAERLDELLGTLRNLAFRGELSLA